MTLEEDAENIMDGQNNQQGSNGENDEGLGSNDDVNNHERKYHLLKSVFRGKVYGRRPSRRWRIPWLKNLGTWLPKTITELFKLKQS